MAGSLRKATCRIWGGGLAPIPKNPMSSPLVTVIIKDPTTPQTYSCTTLVNIWPTVASGSAFFGVTLYIFYETVSCVSVAQRLQDILISVVSAAAQVLGARSASPLWLLLLLDSTHWRIVSSLNSIAPLTNTSKYVRHVRTPRTAGIRIKH